MSHCHDEHAHSHSHAHGGDDQGHSHDHSDDITPALQNILHAQIDFPRLLTLNEHVSDSGRGICEKTWAQRLDADPELVSSADEQLLMLVPFTGQVRLHSIILRTSAAPCSPKTLKVFVNPPEGFDFDTASSTDPTQILEVSMTSEVQEIPVRRVLFSTTRSLALFIEDNWSHGEDEETRLGYVAFKGDFLKLIREAISVLYESAANPKDHKVKGVGVGEGVGRSIQ